MINNSRLLLLLTGLIAVSCVNHEIEFEGQTRIRGDGSIQRRGSIEISGVGALRKDFDSTKAAGYYEANYIAPGEEIFDVSTNFAKDIFTVTWQGELGAGVFPISDYIHRSGDGPTAANSISVEIRNRLFYRDIYYSEIFSDPVDTAGNFPVISRRFRRPQTGF